MQSINQIFIFFCFDLKGLKNQSSLRPSKLVVCAGQDMSHASMVTVSTRLLESKLDGRRVRGRLRLRRLGTVKRDLILSPKALETKTPKC